MRGKRRDGTLLPASTGITPAGAGKTFSELNKRTTNQDHPRRCGENSGVLFAGRRQSGSPPQVRGKHYDTHTCSMFNGITPAGAGKTINGRLSSESEEDHPRRCGENQIYFDEFVLTAGSPPQVRGKLQRLSVLWYPGRITPAGAGKTLKRSFRNQPFCS